MPEVISIPLDTVTCVLVPPKALCFLVFSHGQISCGNQSLQPAGILLLTDRMAYELLMTLVRMERDFLSGRAPARTVRRGALPSGFRRKVLVQLSLRRLQMPER